AYPRSQVYSWPLWSRSIQLSPSVEQRYCYDLGPLEVLGSVRSNGLLQLHDQAHDGLTVLVEETRAEIGGATAVDDGGADDVATLVQGYALRDSVVDHALAVIVERDHRLAIEPPARRGVRADGETHARNLARRVHRRLHPEEHVRRGLR